MSTKSCLLIVLLSALVAAPILGLSSAGSPVATRSFMDPAGLKTRGRLNAVHGNLPLQFEPNQGQADPRFDFVSRAPGYGLFLSAAETVLVFNKNHRGSAPDLSSQKLTMKPVGSDPHSRPRGEGILPGRVNYLIGNDAKSHHTGISTYGQVRYQNIYPGIDMLYYGRQRQLEFDFIVAPGANPSEIVLQLEGATALQKDAKDMVVSIGADSIRLEKPFVYQEIDGRRVEIASAYVLRASDCLGFEIGNYDQQLPLVIDPVLGYSSFLGGTGAEMGHDITLDGAGNIYLTGFTTSAQFPHTDNSVPKGGFDVFITKLSPDGSTMIFSTFFGGSGFDTGMSVAVDADSVYVSGLTDSQDYPTTSGAFQETPNAVQTGFVTKLNSAANTLLYSSHFGGGVGNNGSRMALDAAGDIYLCGSTNSTTLPTTSNAFQTSLSPPAIPGSTDAYIAKIHPAGEGPSDLIYSTYLGGNLHDGDAEIRLDGAGFVYLAGTTNSTNFPTTPDAFARFPSNTDIGQRQGNWDAFLIKMDLRANGAASLVYSTYIGGIGDETVGGLSLDMANNAYLSGRTSSVDFPVTRTALQRFSAGKREAYVLKLNPSQPGTAGLLYSTYLGGSEDENSFGSGVAVDGVGNAYLTGDTRSTNLPITVGAFQPSIGGVSDVFSAPGGDAFVAKLNAAGTALVYFTYLGGSGGDGGNAIAIDSQGNAYVTGYTFSENFPLSPNAMLTTQGGQFDAFVARVANPSSFASSNPGLNSRASETVVDGLPNPIDEAQKFVRQQYIDFLNREPDPSGLAFWTDQIAACGSDANCISVKRINVSAAFFLSIEFQQTGYLVDRLYLTSFARTPRLREFWPDSRQISEGVIVNSPGWEQILENNKQAFVLACVQRAEFQAAYPTSMTAVQFVNLLDANAGSVLTPPEKELLVSFLEGTPGDNAKRAIVLRTVAENSTLQQKEFNKAFVLMQYFGYLQRNPDDPPDNDQSGYNFWLGKLNQFNGNFVDAEMVKAFISAGEYRTRFGQN